LLPLIGQSGREKQAFTESVYYTRNYLTHHTREDAPKAAYGDKLLFITDCLSIALQVCFLDELHFTPQQRVEIFRKHELYQFMLAQKPYLNM
jgi:ApeA N-terminal domain 1